VQLLHHLACTHNLWHTAAQMITTQSARNEGREQGTAGKLDPIRDSQADLYLRLGEHDTWYGLWRLRNKLPETTRALGWEQQGCWEQAQTAYEAIVQTTQQQGAPLREAEFQLWEEHWMLMAKRLGQHDLLLKLAEDTGNHQLMVESAWKLRKWRQTKEAVGKLEATAEKAFSVKLHQAMALLGTSDEPDSAAVIKLTEEATQLGLQRWQALPEVVGAAHVPLLQEFQRLVEVQESANVVTAHLPAGKRGRYGPQEVTNTLDAWRHRMPCVWDEVEVWDDLMLWRLFVFERLRQVLQPSQVGDVRLPGISADMPFKDLTATLNKLAEVARKHRLKSVCHQRLQLLYNLGNVPPGELFRKAREQLLCEMQLDPGNHGLQLEIINNTNLTFFTTEQNGELVALKATILHHKGDFQEANKFFSTAVTLNDDVGYSWVSWHLYCDHMFTLASATARRDADRLRQVNVPGAGSTLSSAAIGAAFGEDASSTEAGATGGAEGGPAAKRASSGAPLLVPEGPGVAGAAGSEGTSGLGLGLGAEQLRESARNTARQAREWGVAAITCAVTALRCKISTPQAQSLVARCFLLLSHDDAGGAMGQAFNRLAEAVEPQVWLPWLPQLLTNLNRPEGKFVLPVIARIAKHSPQAIYYHLRTAFLEIRSAHQGAQEAWRNAQQGPAKRSRPEAVEPTDAAFDGDGGHGPEVGSGAGVTSASAADAAVQRIKVGSVWGERWVLGHAKGSGRVSS
jgi:transformation/transcription domain-associated protein